MVAAPTPAEVTRTPEEGAVTVRATLRLEGFEMRLAASPARDGDLVLWTIHAVTPIEGYEECPLAVMVDGQVTAWRAARTQRRDLHVPLDLAAVRALAGGQSVNGRVCTSPWTLSAEHLLTVRQFLTAFDEELRWASATAH